MLDNTQRLSLAKGDSRLLYGVFDVLPEFGRKLVVNPDELKRFFLILRRFLLHRLHRREEAWGGLSCFIIVHLWDFFK